MILFSLFFTLYAMLGVNIGYSYCTKKIHLDDSSFLSSHCLAVSSDQSLGLLSDLSGNKNPSKSIAEQWLSIIENMNNNNNVEALYDFLQIQKTEVIKKINIGNVLSKVCSIRRKKLSEKNFFPMLWYWIHPSSDKSFKTIDNLIVLLMKENFLISSHDIILEIKGLIQLKGLKGFIQKLVTKKMMRKLISFRMSKEKTMEGEAEPFLFKKVIKDQNSAVFRYLVEKQSDQLQLKMSAIKYLKNVRKWSFEWNFDWEVVRSVCFGNDKATYQEKSVSFLDEEIFEQQLKPIMRKDNLEQFLNFLSQNAIDIYAEIDEEGSTFLHLASELGSKKIALYLLDVCDMDVDAKNRKEIKMSPIFYAWKNGQRELIRCFLEHGANVNHVDDGENTLLHSAVVNQDGEMVQLLIEHGANVDASNANLKKPIDLAFDSYNAKVLQLLIENGADVRYETQQKNNLLHFACKTNNLDLMRNLLENYGLKDSVNSQNHFGQTPLHVASRYGDVEVLEILIQNGAIVNIVDALENSILNDSLWNKDGQVLKFLLDNYKDKLDVNMSNRDGNTPIHFAIAIGTIELLKELLKAGKDSVDVNIQNEEGNTPIHFAVSNDIALLKCLVEAGKDSVDVNIQNKAGNTPIHLAVSRHDIALLKCLVEAGKDSVDVNIQNKAGNTPIHLAIKARDINCLKCLLEAGKDSVDVNIKNEQGNTPIHLASETTETDFLMGREYGGIEFLKCLLESGKESVDVNIQNEEKNTPIHLAIWFGNREALNALLEAGKTSVDVNMPNKQGNNLIHLAVLSKDIALLKYLLEVGKESVDVNIQNEEKNTPIHLASKNGDIDCLKCLLEVGKDSFNVNMPNKQGNTPIHLASKNGDIDCLKCLLEVGKDSFNVNMPNKQGNTLIHLAIERKHINCLKYLIEAQKENVNVNIQNEEGNTPIHLAIKSEDIDFLKCLIAAKKDNVNVNIQNEEGKTPFYLAYAMDLSEMGKILIENDVSVLDEYFCVGSFLYEFVWRATVPYLDWILENNARRKHLLNVKDMNGETPLHWAVERNRLDMVKGLIAHNANVNSVDYDKWTALHLAVARKNLDMVKVLIESGAGITKTHSNKTILHLASSQTKNGEMLTYFFEKCKSDIDVNARSVEEETPLHIAAQNGDILMLQTLINKGAQINVLNNKRLTPLAIAIQNENEKIVLFLIQSGADVDLAPHGETLLHMAVKTKSLKIVQAIVEKKGNLLDEKDYAGKTALFYAIDNQSIVKFLLRSGARPKAESQSLMALAVERGRLGVVQSLMEYGVRLEEESNKNKKLLHLASASGNLDLVKDLLSKKIFNLEDKDDDGNTVLHLAIRSEKLDLVKYLIETAKTPFDFKDKNNEGATVWHLATQIGSDDVLKYLLIKTEYNLSIDDPNLFNDIILNLARNNSMVHLKVVIEKYGGHWAYKDSNGNTILHLAIMRRNLDLVKYLIETEKISFDFKDQNNEGETVWHLATQIESDDVLRYLLIKTEYNLSIDDPNLFNDIILNLARNNRMFRVKRIIEQYGGRLGYKNSNGETVLHLASQSGNLELVKYWVDTNDFNLKDKNEKKETLLHLASGSGDSRLVQYLVLTKKFNLNETGGDGGCRALDYAIVGDRMNLQLIRYLVGQGADINTKTTNGLTPIGRAIQCKKVKIAYYLLEKRCEIEGDFNQADEIGRDFLSSAIEIESFNLVYFLVQHGVDLNPTESLGFSFLHHAYSCYRSEPDGYFERQRYDIFRYIAERTTDLKVKSESQEGLGKTVLEYAQSENKNGIVQILTSITAHRALVQSA